MRMKAAFPKVQSRLLAAQLYACSPGLLECSDHQKAHWLTGDYFLWGHESSDVKIHRSGQIAYPRGNVVDKGDVKVLFSGDERHNEPRQGPR